MISTLDRAAGRTTNQTATIPRWAALALPVAATWSLTYLGLGVAWLTGAGGNPADPAVDRSVSLSLLGTWGAQTGALILTSLAGLGVLLAAVMIAVSGRPGAPAGLVRVTTYVSAGLGLVLAVAMPDFRLLATIGYTPILIVLAIFGSLPDGIEVLWSWPMLNMAALTLAGLAWAAAAVAFRRRALGPATAPWMAPDRAARWGRWAVAVAVVVPVGYALTRYAWALGIPLGVSQDLLDQLGDSVYVGAGLATLGVGGAVLTLGLIQRWGEVFPRWIPRLRSRRVPVGLAVVPASIVAVVVGSAGLMFVRFGITGELAEQVPRRERRRRGLAAGDVLAAVGVGAGRGHVRLLAASTRHLRAVRTVGRLTRRLGREGLDHA